MRKSDKKLDNDIRKRLGVLCEEEFESIDGFQWLTHTVNYSNFPTSLNIICVFETDDNVRQFLASTDKNKAISTVESALFKLNIKLKTPSKHFRFDSEEACNRENKGNWAMRLA